MTSKVYDQTVVMRYLRVYKPNTSVSLSRSKTPELRVMLVMT